MNLRHVIYLTGGSAVLYTRERSRFAPVAEFDLEAGDGAALVTTLRQAPAVVAIIVDVPEEEHHRDTMPRLGARDQAAMLARKLNRLFPRTSYRAAAVQDRLPDAPDTQRILLSGLPKAEQLAGLQALLAAARIPVSVVCSPALLSRPLIERLRPAQPAATTLIVSRHREGGLRVSYFRGRHLAGSRLIRPAVAAPPGDFARLTRQLEESVRYFDAAFAPSAANPVDVLLVCDDVPSGAAMETGHEGFRLHVPDPATVARRLRVPVPGAGNADLLFVELLRRCAPAGNYSPAEERRYFQLHQLRVFGRAACVGLGAAALAGSAINVAGFLDVGRELATTRAAVADVSSQLDAGLRSDGMAGTDPLEMQRIGTSWQLLRRHSVEPEQILGLLSQALESNPQIQLEGIEWAHLQVMAATPDDEEAPVDETTEPEVDAAEAGDAPLTSGEQRVRLTIKGRVEPFDGNYPLAFLGVRTFMSSLGADPRVISVKARQEPLDVSPRSSLTGEMTPETRVDKASFSLNLLLRFDNGPA